jgi:hypothetical protein
MKAHHHSYDPLTRNHDFDDVSNLTYLTKLYAVLSPRYVVHLNPCNIVYYVECPFSFAYAREPPMQRMRYARPGIYVSIEGQSTQR